MKTITTEDHAQLFEEFEAAAAIAFDGQMDTAWQRDVDDIGNPMYFVSEGHPQDQQAIDWINACFIGFCIAKGFVGKFEEN